MRAFILRQPLIAIALIFLSSTFTLADDLGIRAPENFEVSLYAGDDLAHDIYSMTIDSHGRIVVAGAGYIKTLFDDDGDGRADRVVPFSDKPASGAHGLLFDGEWLYATGDNGIWKFRDADGDGVADAPPERWVDGLSHAEHGANGLTMGPDGWIYVVCGNDAGVSEKFITSPDSPVKKPECGAILRISPDGSQREVVAHGFRNPYDLCFHPQGNIFTVDADGERDHHLPWYAPTRLFDVAIGMHHGWVQKGWQSSWSRPAYFFDNVERCAEIGRGSPTGMTCYRHTQFPAKYQGGIFSACWTLGRVYHFPLTPRGSTFDGKVDIFLETTGQVGFAPVDIAVGPAGDMFVAIGGRGTRGSLFKVSYVGRKEEPERQPVTEIEKILAAPQPLDAWSRAKWVPEARKLNGDDFMKAVLDGGLPEAWRARGVEISTELFDGLSKDAIAQLHPRAEKHLGARIVWSLGRKSAVTELIKRFSGIHPIDRSIWEALISCKPAEDSVVNADCGRHDARLRRLLRLTIERGYKSSYGETSQLSTTVDERVTAFWKWLEFRGKLVNFGDDAALIRELQLLLGDIDPNGSPPGYTLARADVLQKLFDPQIVVKDVDIKLRHALLKKFFGEFTPYKIFGSGREHRMKHDHESARLAALLKFEDSEIVELFSTYFLYEKIELDDFEATTIRPSTPDNDIHFLMCLAQMPGKRTEKARANIAAAISLLDSKMKARSWHPSRNWPDRVGETFAALVKHDPELPAAVVAHEAFKSPSQAFLFLRLDKKHQQAAARKLLKCLAEAKDDEARWTPELVKLVATLPEDEALTALRSAWDEFALHDVIALELVKFANPGDKPLLFEALGSIQVDVVEAAAKVLPNMVNDPSEQEWLMAMQALRQLCAVPQGKAARKALIASIKEWSGQTIEVKEKGEQLYASYQPWFDWFAKAYPKQAHKLGGTGEDWPKWRKRLANLDWSTGDVERGKLAFEKRSCSKCHGGTSPLGPDLSGAAGRFSKEDLFAAIIEPSKEVAPLFQATQIETATGRVYHGIVVYESPDGTLLTTGPDSTIRIAGDEITSLHKSRLSIMPTGLLNNADDRELADLSAYLATLKGKK